MTDFTPFQRILFFIAFFSSAILVIQLAMSFFAGIGHDVDVDHDVSSNGHHFDGPHFQLISVRSIVAFFVMFSWIGLACDTSNFSMPITLLLASFSGVAMMFVVAILFVILLKLQSSGNIDYSTLVGLTAHVTIPIPAMHSGNGKINVALSDRNFEMTAITESESELPSNCIVSIKLIKNQGIALVEKV